MCKSASVWVRGDSDVEPHSSSAHPLLHSPAVLREVVSIPPLEKNVPGSPDAHPRLQAEAQVAQQCVQLDPGQDLPGGASPQHPVSAAFSSCCPKAENTGSRVLSPTCALVTRVVFDTHNLLKCQQTHIPRADGRHWGTGYRSRLFLEKGTGSSKPPHGGDKKQDTICLGGQQQAVSDCEQSIEMQWGA